MSNPLDETNDRAIATSWQKNAKPWAIAVREGQIDSREQVTNRAIVDAVSEVLGAMGGERSPQTVLDIGCGEGWLVRALAATGAQVTGVDGEPALIEQAREADGADFYVMTYEELAAGQLNIRVDVAVCNFSLIGKGSVDGLLRIMPTLLNPQGALVIQTLHPVVTCRDEPYVEGWRSGSWAGFSDSFTDPAPWYFRPIQSWVALLHRSGFRLQEIREPLHPKTQQPVSMVFVARVASECRGDT
ncbi:class I SAM-dependent methyltransferase [Leptolyngbya sp. AN02str]|uniref:class I SAM-dependent methyltransferase n=1 Tax=Leptolyngbya sp. AN02str TaxID=3423363 RepID=UPI003D321DFB